MKSRKSILYLSHVSWDWLKQRPHFIAEGLANEYNVFFTYSCNFHGIREVEYPSYIKFIKLFRLPFERFHIIYIANKLLYNLQILMYYRNIDIIWVTSPQLVDWCPKFFLKKCFIIYDCMDDMMEFRMPLFLKKNIYKNEQFLLDKANIVLSSSNHLKMILEDRYGRSDIYVINNAIKEIESIPIQQEFIISSSNNKKIIYIGTISDWFDFDCLEFILKQRNDVEFHLYGKAEIEMPNIPGIFFHGAVQHNDVFNIMNKADALIMPFKLTPLILSVNPVKLYEYIYSGKPCIAPKYGETEQFRDFVYLYDNKESLLKIINVSLSDDKILDVTANIEFVMNNTWKIRVNSIKDIIKKSIIFA